MKPFLSSFARLNAVKVVGQPAVRGVAVLLACLVLAGWLLWAAVLRPAVSVVHAAVWPGDHQQSCSIITRVSDNDQSHNQAQ